MKYLSIFFIILMCSCVGSTAQSQSEEIQQEQEFEKLLNKVEENQKTTLEVQKKAEKSQEKIVNKTIEKIVDLKLEVNELKKELNSISSDTNSKFKLLPISDN